MHIYRNLGQLLISARNGTFFLFLSILHQNKALHNFGTRGQCSIVKCNIGLEYALTYFVLSTRTIIAASFTSLNLLSTFHIRFLKNNSVFSKFLFSLQCLALVVCCTVLFVFHIFELLWNLKFM